MGTPLAETGPPDVTTPQTQFWGTTPLRFLLLSLFWLPISLFWGAMLGQVLPARVLLFAGDKHSGTYLATISICGAAVGLLIQLMIGPISDACASRWGRRRPFLVVGTLLAVVALLAFANAGSFAGLVLAFMGIQLFLNVANGPYQALIPDHVPPAHQGAASGFMGVMSLLGDAGGPVVAGLLLAHARTPAAQVQAIQHLMWLVAGLLLLFMAVTVLLVPDAPPAFRRPVAASLRETYRLHVRENPDFYWLLASRAVFNLGFYTVVGFLLLYVKFALHTGAAYSKPLTILQEIAIGGALLGTLPAGFLADRVSKKTVIYVSSALSILAGLAFALTSSLPFALGMALLFGMGLGTFRAVDWAFACNLLPQGGAAKFMSIWSLSTMLPQLVAPTFGFASDALNRTFGLGAGPRGAMLMSLVYTILGTLLITRVRERRPPKETQT